MTSTAVTKDAALAVWEAMNLLAKARAWADTVDTAETLAEAEMHLFTLLSNLARKAGAREKLSTAATTFRINGHNFADSSEN